MENKDKDFWPKAISGKWGTSSEPMNGVQLFGCLSVCPSACPSTLAIRAKTAIFYRTIESEVIRVTMLANTSVWKPHRNRKLASSPSDVIDVMKWPTFQAMRIMPRSKTQKQILQRGVNSIIFHYRIIYFQKYLQFKRTKSL